MQEVYKYMAEKFCPITEYEEEQKPLKVRMGNGKYIYPITELSPVKTHGGRMVQRVDNWIPDPHAGDKLIFSSNFAGAIVAPVRDFYKYTGDKNSTLDIFITQTKKCYNSDPMRQHICHYLNYFENFFDPDHEYFSMLCILKFTIDNGIVNPQTGTVAQYTKEHFIYDLNRMILSPSIVKKVEAMVDHNYSLDLNYKNINNPSLQYGDIHAKRLMECSILINLFIPLLTHFAYMQKMPGNIDGFLLEAFDGILSMFQDVDIVSKLYETAFTNISKSEQSNIGIWAKQDIRGRNVTTHSISSIENIILNIMPKYVFSENIVSMNYSSIINNTNFQIIDIEYEYSFIPLSSSKRVA